MNYSVASRQQVHNGDISSLEEFKVFATVFTENVRIEQAQNRDPNVERIEVETIHHEGRPYSLSCIEGEAFMLNTATFNKDPDDGRYFACLYFWMLELEKPAFEGPVLGFNAGEIAPEMQKAPSIFEKMWVCKKCGKKFFGGFGKNCPHCKDHE